MENDVKLSLGERMIRMETMVVQILSEVQKNNKELHNHVDWEVSKYDEMERRFAPVSLKDTVDSNQNDLKALNSEMNDLPERMKTLFSNIWVEQFLKGVLITVIAAALIAGFFNLG